MTDVSLRVRVGLELKVYNIPTTHSSPSSHLHILFCLHILTYVYTLSIQHGRICQPLQHPYSHCILPPQLLALTEVSQLQPPPSGLGWYLHVPCLKITTPRTSNPSSCHLGFSHLHIERKFVKGLGYIRADAGPRRSKHAVKKKPNMAIGTLRMSYSSRCLRYALVFVYFDEHY